MRARTVTVAFLIAGLLTGPWAMPGHASWVSANCHDNSRLASSLKRADARAYAGYAAHEGYEWGGGCWNNDNADDTRGAPDSGGEGPDCSGLVFKTWELLLAYNAEGFRWYSRWMDVHGPYTAAAFHDASGRGPFHVLPNKSRLTTVYMDAFASTGHIALIWSDSVPSGGGDYVIEAYDDAEGTQVDVRDYRANGSFRAVRRKQWTPDCWPRCRDGSVAPVVVA
jgi:hypothetical protein